MPAPPQKKKIGPYTIEGVLGKGCMGVVYKVRHPELGRYALKVLRTELSSERDLKRFKREIELLAAISEHPNVVKIHSANEDRGRIYYVMDLIQGEDLQAKLKHGPLRPHQAARYVQQIASAVAELHKKEIIHRDIKPANVIVDDRDQARLSDFGLARSFTDEQSRLTLSGEFVGTPLFMAPEQATGKGAGKESDVYALGMVLYTLLAGRPAIQGQSTAEVLQKLRGGQHRPLRKLAPDVPPVLADLVMRTLSMDPRTRPRDAGQLARELGRFVEAREAEDEKVQETKHLVLALVAALVVIVVVGVGAFALLGRGDPQVSASGSSDEETVEQTFAVAREALLGEEPPDETVIERVVATRKAFGSTAELGAAKLAKVGELWAIEGELWLRKNDVTRARACLGQAELIADPKGPSALRNLARRGLGALRAGLGALDPQPTDELVALLQALQAAERIYPDRLDLLDWRVQIAVRFERWEDARKVLKRHPVPDRIPASVRARVFLATDDLVRAESLIAKANEPALMGELRFRQGLKALDDEEWEVARDYFNEGMSSDPEGTHREAALKATRELYADHSDWRGTTRRSRIGRLVQREVSLARALKSLDPAFELPPRRFDVMFRVMAEVGRQLESRTLEVLEGLIDLRPSDLQLYKLYGEVAQEWVFPDPERHFELLRRGYAQAKRPRDKDQLAKSLAWGYYYTRQLDPLIELEASLPDGVNDSRRADLVGRAGDLLRWQGRLKESRKHLERAAELDPDSPNVELFLYWLAKARLNDKRDDEESVQAAQKHGARFLELYPGEGWHDHLPEICSWLARVAATRDRADEAIGYLEALGRYRPDQVQWQAYRLELMASKDPLPESLSSEVDTLKPGLEKAIEYMIVEAKAVVGDRREVLKRRIDKMRKIKVDHLEQAAAIGDSKTLLRGLATLQNELNPLLGDLK